MSISRVDKMICQMLRSDSLSQSGRLRVVDLDVFIGADKTDKAAQMSLTAVALALRSVRGQVRVHLPEPCPPGLRWHQGALADLLRHEAITFGEPSRLELNPTNIGPWKIGIGTEVRGGVCADAYGWTAGINRILGRGKAATAPAAVFATCCAFAKLFSSAVLGQVRYRDESWSMNLADPLNTLTLNGPTATLQNFGVIHLLGAGAIGSGFMYTMWLSGWPATVEIIDDDFYDEPNHETTLMIGIPEVRRNRKKAVALAEISSRDGLQTKARVMRVSKSSRVLSEQSEAFVCAVDNSETRRDLDSVNTNLLVNAGVGGRSEDAGHIVLTRHLKGDPSLSKRYSGISANEKKESVPVEFQDECSCVEYENVSLAAPFIATGAGALLAATCGLQRIVAPMSLNYLKLDILKLQSRFQVES